VVIALTGVGVVPHEYTLPTLLIVSLFFIENRRIYEDKK
jgi:hypothetical protein